MEIGDIVFHQEYGVGKIKFIDGLAYLVYYYKENPLLHNGSIGPNFHYWWSYAEDETYFICPYINRKEAAWLI